MLGLIGGIGKSLAGGIADTAGISTFTSALGAEKKSATKPKVAKVKPFDEEESPTKILQQILTETQTIHRVMASQVVPASEEEEIERDKDVKDQEILDALGNIVPKEDKTKKKKEPWWKILWAWIKPFISWITKPLSWIKSLLSLPFFTALKTFAVLAGRFFLFNPVGIALLTIGIVAINWRDIKKAIKGYVNTIKGWIKTALTAIGLGWMINDPDDDDISLGATDDMEEERFRRETAMIPDDERFAGGEVPQEWVESEVVPEAPEAFADPSILEDQSPEGKDWWIGEDGKLNIMITGGPDSEVPFAGAFQTGGVIPKGKVGLAGEGKGPESVGGKYVRWPIISGRS